MTYISERHLGLLPERSDQGGPALHRAQAVASAGLEVVEVRCAAVGELVMLQMTPDVLDRIELGRIGRELLDLDGSVEGPQVFAYERRAMGGQAVPDDQQGIADLLPERMQKLDELRALDGIREVPEVEAPEGNVGDHGELMPVEVVLQHRRLTLGRPSTSPRGPFAQSRFVDEDDDSALFRSVFFNAGHRVRFQRWIAPAYTSRACAAGAVAGASHSPSASSWSSLPRTGSIIGAGKAGSFGTASSLPPMD